MGGLGLDEADSGSGQVAGCCVYDHELSDSVIYGELLDLLRELLAFEKRTLLHAVSQSVSRATAISYLQNLVVNGRNMRFSGVTLCKASQLNPWLVRCRL